MKHDLDRWRRNSRRHPIAAQLVLALLSVVIPAPDGSQIPMTANFDRVLND